MEENWRITAWELFATIISSVLGFYLLWPVSHQFFWISATIAVAVSLALIFPWRYGLPLGLVSLILGVVVLPHLPPNETQFHGWLTPADDPTPPSPCGPIPPETLGVFLGSSETIWAGVSPGPVISADRKPILALVRDRRGSIAVNAQIFDSRGYIIAAIRHNEFLVNKNNAFRIERPDRHTLVVFDERNQRALYLRFLNHHAIYMEGRFRSPAGRPLIMVAPDFLLIPPGNRYQQACLANADSALNF